MRIFYRSKIIFTVMTFSLLRSSGVWCAVHQPVQFGGEFRGRYEVSDPQNFTGTGAGQTQDLFLLRTRLHGKTSFPDQKLSVFIEIQDSRTSGSEASVQANTANVDLHQGYVDIRELGGRHLDLRVGRQELIYGDQRLISTLDWHNVTRSWDGVKLLAKSGPLQIDAFMTIVNEISGFYEDLKFSGLYGTLKKDKDHEFDLYALSRHSGKASKAGSGASLNLNEWTTGGRIKGKSSYMDYNGELVFQSGKSAGSDIRAWAFASKAGVTVDSHTQTRFGVGYDFASGDSNPADEKVETFSPPFPFGHAYQGYADIFSWKNGHDMYTDITTTVKGLWAQVALHRFRLSESKDAWYNAGGGVIAQDTTGGSGKDIGHELDIHFKMKFRESINLWFGYTRFWGEDFVKRNATGGHNKNFAFIQGVINFD